MDIDDDPVRVGEGEGFKAVVRACGVYGQHIIVGSLGPAQGFDVFALERLPADREIPLSSEPHEEKRRVLFDMVAEWLCRFDDHAAKAFVISNRDFERRKRLGRERNCQDKDKKRSDQVSFIVIRQRSRSNRIMEAAGIEPASEDIQRKVSTCLSSSCLSFCGLRRRKKPQNQP